MNFEDSRYSNRSPNDDRFKSSLYNNRDDIPKTSSFDIPVSPTLSQSRIDTQNDKYPFCIVWTPIPLLTWLFPFLGHMGIAYSSGVIRDFAGSYYVSEDSMAFGTPTKYWQLDPKRANPPGAVVWDTAVMEASNVYTTRVHNLIADNCHSHVAMALNRMKYNGSGSWNMVTLCFMMLLHSKYVSFGGFLRTWLPFMIICCIGFLYIKFSI